MSRLTLIKATPRLYLVKYSADQPRAPDGRFGSVGGSGGSSSSSASASVPIGGGRSGMSSEQYQGALDRMDVTHEAVASYLATEGDTQSQYDFVEGVKGDYSDERTALHEQILSDAMDKVSGVPRDSQAMILGGIPGAGKSSADLSTLGIDKEQYATVNPDDFKQALIDAGAVPQVGDLKLGEAAPVLHEESSDLAGQFANRLMEQGTNVNYDITMASESSVQSRIDGLAKAGYSKPDMIFVDTTPKNAMDSAVGRYGRSMDSPQGGRTVSEDFIKTARSDGTFPNKSVFESVKSQSGQWAMFDNNGPSAVMVAKGTGSG
jgi:hypothetical protein